MIIADKIITLRKKSGWSQEELAQQLNVTRQSVSKWEGAQSIPDLDKILKMSQLFGVSTDYLLKDEITEEKPNVIQEESFIRRVSMEEANAFLTIKEKTAKIVAFATFLCIISPIILILLGGAVDAGVIGLTENAAGGIGLIILFALISIAVALFIGINAKTRDFEFLEKVPVETEYGVAGMVRERQKAFRNTYTRINIIATVFCILSAVPIFVGICISEEDFLLIMMVCLTLFLVAIGVFLFIIVGVPWGSMEMLLQEGDYTRQRKAASRVRGAVSTVYWLLATAIYLAFSYVTDDWKCGQIIWPIAGVIYAAVMIVIRLLFEKDSYKV